MSYTSSMARKRRKPRCIVIAGPNGAGKTTFARDYLPAIAGLINFVNVDLIAGGISPLRPELAAVTAGRLVLRELDRLVKLLRRCRSRTTARGKDRTQGSTHARHSCLFLEERQGRRGEAIRERDMAPCIAMSFQMPPSQT
jgi:hypothetical protein